MLAQSLPLAWSPARTRSKSGTTSSSFSLQVRSRHQYRQQGSLHAACEIRSHLRRPVSVRRHLHATQLARMGATLANDGINPATGEQVIKAENVPEILSAIMMAGLYDASGGWAWHVGLPAKSGVGGGILAVVPGKGAIAVFAPPLDEAGNSVKAQKAIAYVADKLGMNLFSPRSVGLNDQTGRTTGGDR